MTVLQYYLRGVLSTCQFQRGCVYRYRTLPDKTANSLRYIWMDLFFKIEICCLLCASFACAFTKEKPHCYNQCWPNIPYMLQKKLYRPLTVQFSLPHPSPTTENLPPTSRQHTRKVCLHFSGLSCFCTRDRKTTRIDWLIFWNKLEWTNQNWRLAQHENLKRRIMKI